MGGAAMWLGLEPAAEVLAAEIEYSMGKMSELMSTEKPMRDFEITPMIQVSTYFN